jgi:kynurenine formamidase
MFRAMAISIVILTLTACQPAQTPDLRAIFDGTGGRWVDLTYAFSEDAIYWPTADGFRLEEESYGMTPGGWFYSSYRYSASEHGGTHFDAPIHFAESGHTSEEVPLERLVGPAAVVDVSARAVPDYQVSVSDLEEWEVRHGPIPPGAILLLRTGWGKRWPDRVRFLGTDQKGPDAVPLLHFPGLSPEAAQWLVDNREIDAIGIDTPSIDFGQSSTFETHRILYEGNMPGFENIAHLEELPEWGAYVVALPMKIQGGSGGPLRIVAFIPEGTL